MKRTPQDCKNMSDIRESIDALDRELMKLLSLRVEYIDRAAEIKAQIQMPARVEDRVEEVAMNARKNALREGVDPDVAEKLWRKMIEWSIKREEEKLGVKHDSENH